jgi:hypothetical protein
MADAAIHGTFNNGEDVTRPVNLFQIRERYQQLPNARGLEPEKCPARWRQPRGRTLFDSCHGLLD